MSVFATTPSLDSGTIEAVVTVPTFKRPGQVLETLASLKAQDTDAREDD